MLSRIIICIALISLSFPAFASRQEDSLWRKFTHTKDPSQKVNALLAILEEYDLRNNMVGRDSIFEIGLEDVYIKTQDSLLAKMYNWYFDKEEEFFTDGAPDYAKSFSDINAKHNTNSWRSDVERAHAKSCLYRYKTQEALDAASQAFYYASLAEDSRLKIKAMLLLGYCLEKNNKKIEAFKKYTDALYLSRQTENTELVFLSYQSMASFYYQIFNFEKAKEYVNEQYKLLSSTKPADSLAVIKLDVIYTLYLFGNNELHPAEKNTKRILDYTVHHNYQKLTHIVFTAYRTYLINNSLFQKLSDLYTKQYPGALAEIAQNNPNLYFRLKAFISEANGQIDSAEHYYVLAEENLIAAAKGNIYTANFYKRYGEFLVRRGNISNAEVKLKLAFDFAEKAQFIPYLTELSRELDSLSFSQGKVNEAYKYARLSLQYGRQAELVHQEEELLKLEVKSEAKERELTAQRELEAIERKHNIQYMGISIVIVFSFILLAIIGSFKVHKVMIKAMGFFSFIFFFEFIIMLADHKIHHITHGEPWKFLAFKICLIAILLPLHHWIEEKVIHYLVSHKMVDQSKISVKTFLRNFINNMIPGKGPIPEKPAKHPEPHEKPTIVKEKE